MLRITTLETPDVTTVVQMKDLIAQLSPPPASDTFGDTLRGNDIFNYRWVKDIIASPFHDQFVAFDDDGRVVGTATMSVILAAKHQRIAYLEDFVVDKDCRGQGIGTKIWDAIVDWARTKGCERLEFTSSGTATKTGAVSFYKACGAEIRNTNCFRYEIPPQITKRSVCQHANHRHLRRVIRPCHHRAHERH